MKLQKPSSDLANASYREKYDYMFNIVRFGSTKEVTDHIMYQREVIASLQGQLQNKLMPMAETYAQIKRRKRLEFIDNLILTAGAVFFVVVGAMAIAGSAS